MAAWAGPVLRAGNGRQTRNGSENAAAAQAERSPSSCETADQSNLNSQADNMVITDSSIKASEDVVAVKESELKEHSAKMEAMKVRDNKFISCWNANNNENLIGVEDETRRMKSGNGQGD